MGHWVAVIGAIVAVGMLYVVMPVVALTYRRFRSSRVVTCPDGHNPAEIGIDAMHAAASAAFGKPALEITRCSRWPEHRDCGRECLAEVR